MTAKSQSVRDRLKNIARQHKISFQNLLVRYGNECFLARLAQTSYADNFILKGGLSLLPLNLPRTRPTKDIDFLGRGIENALEDCARIVADIAQLQLDDGVIFHPDTVTADIITEQANYPGTRVKLKGHLGNAELSLQIDFGFGDATVPDQPPKAPFPRLLDPDEEICVRMYSVETIVAEKYEVLVAWGQLNSRMKDIYDLYHLCANQPFDGRRLGEALRQTFQRRRTPLTASPLAFQPAYLADGSKQKDWRAHLRKHRLEAPELKKLADVLARVQVFLAPLCEALAQGHPWSYTWNPENQQWEPEREEET